ncbi:MAG: hypothetical protein MUF72_08090 [Elainella sp. Prado103]|jgi:hypothetical protein|nr:hypothetical protein [Elainella sp. Prado103]
MPYFEKPLSKQFPQVAGLVVLGLLVASCSENKVSQCNRLIEIANQAVSGVEAVSETRQPDDVESMNRIADISDAAKTQMEGLQLSDPQLKDYQTRFVAMYTDTTQATRDLVASVGQKDTDAARKAFDALQAATAQEGPLVNEVNTYCNASSLDTSSPAAPVSPSPTPSP